MDVAFSVSAPDIGAVVQAMCDRGWIDRAPSGLEVDYKKRKVTPDALSRFVPLCKKSLVARWDGSFADAPYRPKLLACESYGLVKLILEIVEGDPIGLAERVTELPIEIASFGTLHDDRYDAETDYLAPSFSDGHYPLGWACAFKNDGHRRLVSRRWLDFGPWHLRRIGQDASLIQFHELGADSRTALMQAKAGHDRMGISEDGGFIQSRYLYDGPVRGLYEPAEKLLKVIVHGREIAAQEMLDLCAARREQVLGADKPLERVAYVFMVEAEARQHLHELWLRELECWTIIDGRNVRLDTEYRPTPEPPEWVNRLRVQSPMR